MSEIQNHVNISFTASSANGALSTAAASRATKVVLIASEDCYWNSGQSSVTATTSDRLLTAATPVQVTLPYGHDNVGAIRVGTDGVLTVYELG